MNVTLFSPKAPQVSGLPDHIQGIVDQMWAQWAAKLPRNAERSMYLAMKNRFRDLEIALPPEVISKLDVTVGWAEKAVYELSNRIVFEGVSMADGSDVERFGLGEMMHANRFSLEFAQAVVSSVSSSTVFATTTPGDTSKGEPSELLMFHPATFATGIWSPRLRALSAGFIVNKVDDLSQPTMFTVFLADVTFVCEQVAGKWVIADAVANRIGRVPMEQLPFRPTLERPFGKSRIDRRVMSLIDRHMSASARLDVHSELFATLKLMLLGADENTFRDQSGNQIPLWSFVMGRLNGIPKDSEGETPTLETILAQSPEPHIANLRQLTSEFSGHTGVPMSQLGIATDNAESADAKTEARQDIVQDAESQQIIYGSSLGRLFENVVMLREGLQSPPPELRHLSFQWRRPDRPSMASLADAGTKQVSAIPGLAETDVGMEMLGLTPTQVSRARSELKRNAGPSLLDRVLDRRQPEPEPAAAVVE